MIDFPILDKSELLVGSVPPTLFDAVLMFCRDALERHGYVLLDAVVDPDEWPAVRDQIPPRRLRRDLQKQFPFVISLRRSVIRAWLTGSGRNHPQVSPAVLRSLARGHSNQTSGYFLLRNG